MRHLIAILKNKTEREKTRYAFLFACGVTLLVGAIWTTSLPTRFTQIGAPDDIGNISDATENADFAELLESSKAQIGTLIEGIQEPAPPDSEETELYEVSNTFDVNTLSGYKGVDTVPQHIDISENASPDIVQNSVPATTSSPVTLLAQPAPQIIMIATTTSQKSE